MLLFTICGLISASFIGAPPTTASASPNAPWHKQLASRRPQRAPRKRSYPEFTMESILRFCTAKMIHCLSNALRADQMDFSCALPPSPTGISWSTSRWDYSVFSYNSLNGILTDAYCGFQRRHPELLAKIREEKHIKTRGSIVGQNASYSPAEKKPKTMSFKVCFNILLTKCII